MKKQISLDGLLNRISQNEQFKFNREKSIDGELTAIQKLKSCIKLMCFLKRSSEQQTTNIKPYEALKLALLKSQNNRGKSDEIVIERYMKKLTFFQELRQKFQSTSILKISQGYIIFQEFCRHLSLRVSPNNTQVIKKGHFGEFFYVLLKGTVKIYIYNPKNNEAQSLINYQQQMLEKGNFIPIDYNNQELFDSMEIAQLEAGSTFGEIALLEKNQLTSATVLTKGQCEFAIMDRDTFWKCTGKQKSEEYEKKVRIIKHIPFISHWSDVDLKSLCYDFKLKEFGKGQIIYRENNTNLGLYIIIKGEITLSKKIPNKGQSNLDEFQDLLIKSNRQQNLKVSILTANQYFGDEKSNLYQYTATSTSLTTQAYFIAKVDLDRRVQWNKKSKQTYNQITQIRSGWHESRSNSLISHLNQPNKLILEDGQVIDQSTFTQYLNFPHNLNYYKNLSNQNERVSSTLESSQIKLDFMSAKQVMKTDLLLDPLFENKQNYSQINLQKLPEIQKMKESSTQNLFERARMLGLGQQDNERAKKKKDKLQKQLFLKGLTQLMIKDESFKKQPYSAFQSSPSKSNCQQNRIKTLSNVQDFAITQSSIKNTPMKKRLILETGLYQEGKLFRRKIKLKTSNDIFQLASETSPVVLRISTHRNSAEVSNADPSRTVRQTFFGSSKSYNSDRPFNTSQISFINTGQFNKTVTQFTR